MDHKDVINLFGWFGLTYMWRFANKIYISTLFSAFYEASIQARKQWLNEHEKYCVGCDMLKEMCENEGKDK